MAVSTMIVISGYTFPALSTDLTLTRTHSTYELVYEKDLNLSTLPRPTYKDADDQEQTVDGSYRLSVNPTEVAADAKEKFVKVLFYPATGELSQMEEVLKINVHWYKRYPFIKDLVLPVPSTITSESLSITLTGDTDWGYKGSPCEITAEQILAANSGLADDLVTAAGEMEYDSEAVPGVWSVLGASYDGVSGSCSVQFKWVPEDNKSFATLTASVDMSVTDNRKNEVDLLTNLIQHWGFQKILNTPSYTYFDSSIENNTLSLQRYGGVPQVDGVLDKAGYYSSSNSYCSVTTSSFFGNDFSVAFWVKLEHISPICSPFIKLPQIKWKGNAGFPYGFSCIIGAASERKITVGIVESYTFNGEVSDDIGFSLENNWCFVVLTYEKETTKTDVYVNNKKVLSFSDNYIVDAEKTGNLTLGDYFSNDDYFTGEIDDVAMWNKVLIQKEIDFLYNNGNGVAYEDYE